MQKSMDILLMKCQQQMMPYMNGEKEGGECMGKLGQSMVIVQKRHLPRTISLDRRSNSFINSDERV